MQIICPNCGSKSPIEAGSLVTQTRIVCARCAVEFSAELSDEQKAVPAAEAGERGIELFRAGEAAPAFQARPVAVPEVAAPAEATEVVLAEEVAAAEPAREVLHADEVSPAAEVAVGVAAVEATPAVEDSPTATDAHEVLSLPEDALLANEAAPTAGVAEVDHSNVLEDVFAAWNQSRESRPGADAVEAAPVAAAEDYVTSPLSPDYEAALREDHQHEVEPAERPSAEALEASANESAKPVEAAAEEAVETPAETEDDWREPVQPTFADVPVAPQVAAARSFDGYGLGVRLMRVSPLWLLGSGLSFISFVVFCNWFFVPANLAQADAPRPAARRNEATNRSLTDAASAADLAASRPDSRNSSTTASLPAEAEIVNASVKAEETQPTPAAPAPTAAPAATPKAEQPKAGQPKAVETVAEQPAGKFTVQVGSYSAPGEAEARASNLRSAGQSVRVVEVEIPKRGKWYRVYVGGFASRADAESHGKGLRERGLAESYIAAESQ